MRTSFFELWLSGIRPCVSNQNQPHDVVEANTCLKMWDECRKGEDAMECEEYFTAADLTGMANLFLLRIKWFVDFLPLFIILRG